MIITKENYIRLNNSFKPKLIFRFNSGSGFYSEYNNMLLTILYCLVNKIQFNLCSKPGIFEYKKGWQDYFQAFCPENNSFILNKANFRAKPKKVFTSLLGKKIYNYQYLTYDVFNKVRSPEFYNQYFDIPQLNLKGNLYEVLKVLNNIIYSLNPEIQQLYLQKKQELNIPEKYLALHLRGGDKKIEDKLFLPDEYMETLILQNKTIKNIFILTDDYRLFKLLQQKYTDYKFYTLAQQDENGYYIDDIARKNRKKIYDMHINLIIQMEFLKNAEFCVGTQSSNPGEFLMFAMNGGKFIKLDTHNSQLWW